MNVQTIQFGDQGQVATRELLKRFERLRPEISGGKTPAMEKLREALRSLDALDRQFGGSSPIPLEDADQLAASAIVDLAHLENDCRNAGFEDASMALAELVVGVALWAIRHAVPIQAPDHVTNALAFMSNGSRSKPELSAVFGLMHGFIEHVRPQLSADLDRSDPQRPWRLMHGNLAVTAIRTEDPRLMEIAFDALDAALPDERAFFYAEALSRALGPDIAPEVKECIEKRHRRWNLP